VKIKIRSDKKTGANYLKLSDFKDIINVRKVDKVELCTCKDGFDITFYDKDGDILIPKTKGEIAYYNPRSEEVGIISYDCQAESYQAESLSFVWLIARSKSQIVKDVKSYGNVILGEL
jgi:hypothetical protein